VLDGINLEIHQGEFIALLGPNGCGKTTLLKVIAGLLPASEGAVRVNGMDPYHMKRKQLAKIVGFVTQDFVPTYNYTVKQIVLTGRLPYAKGFFSSWTDEDMKSVHRSLEKVDGSQFMERPFYNLSTGEQKRIAIARMLAQDTPVLLLDEPTAHLDPGHIVKIRDLLRTLHQENKTLIGAFHDINIAAELCNRLVLMKEGKIIVCGKPEEVINTDNLERIYDVRVSIITNPATKRPIVVY